MFSIFDEINMAGELVNFLRGRHYSTIWINHARAKRVIYTGDYSRKLAEFLQEMKFVNRLSKFWKATMKPLIARARIPNIAETFDIPRIRH
jgi:hypothetical protein